MQFILIRSHRKSLALTISTDGVVVVKAPQHISNTIIQEFIVKNQNWIQHQQNKLLSAKKFSEGLFLGQNYPIKYDEETPNILTFDGQSFILNQQYKYKTQALLIKWYKNRAATYFQQEANKLISTHGFKIKLLKISNARTRWGSCTHDNKILLNWRLVMLPKSVITYVLIHELVHTLEKNHSKNFWTTVAKYFPEYKTANKLLRENNFLLSFH